MTTLTTSITASVPSSISITDYLPNDDITWYPTYTATLYIGETSIDVDGYVYCGWLARGASGDIDGSGLEVWGSYQPGGWRSVRGDGQEAGIPTACVGTGICTEIHVGAANLSCVIVDMYMVPEWQASHDAITAAIAAHGETSDEVGDLLDAHDALVAEIVAAIDDALEEYPSVDEPTDEQIYDAADTIEESESIRVCVDTIVWVDSGGEYHSVRDPDRDDVARIMEETALAQSILDLVPTDD